MKEEGISSKCREKEDGHRAVVPVLSNAGGRSTYAGALVVLRNVDLQMVHWMSMACWFYMAEERQTLASRNPPRENLTTTEH